MNEANRDQLPQGEDIFNRNSLYLDIIEIHKQRYKKSKLREHLWQKSRRPFVLGPLLGAAATMHLRAEEMNVSEKSIAGFGAVVASMVLASLSEKKEITATQDAYKSAKYAAELADAVGAGRDTWITEGLANCSPD